MVVHAYYPHGETRVQREAEALVKAGWEVDVICLRQPREPSRVRYRSVEVHRMPVRRWRGGVARQLANYVHFLVLATLRLNRLDRRRRYATVQVHNVPDFLVFSALTAKLRGSRVLLDLHDLMPEFFAARSPGRVSSLLSGLILAQERAACRFADHVITVSEHWREALAERGVDRDRCSVVMNVADPAIFAHVDPEDRPAPSPGGLKLIYHGTIPERYGLDLAIRAVHLVRQQFPDTHLTIVGSGEHLPELVRLVGELELDGSVSFLRGRIAEKLPELISAADLGIVPYRDDPFTDGLLPTKLMEYAAVGLPAIAARTSAIESYFENTMVEFFTPGSVDDLVRCLLQLSRSPERLMELAGGSRRFNDRYSWASIAPEYVSLVDRLGAPGPSFRSHALEVT